MTLQRPPVARLQQLTDPQNGVTASWASGATFSSAAYMGELAPASLAVIVGSAVASANKVIGFQVSRDTASWFFVYNANGARVVASATAQDAAGCIVRLPIEADVLGAFPYVRGVDVNPGLGVNGDTQLVFVGLT